MPSPCWHLPLGFLQQQWEQSCLLCCFTPHQLHFQHLKGREKARLQDAAGAELLWFVSLSITFPTWLPLGVVWDISTRVSLHLCPQWVVLLMT